MLKVSEIIKACKGRLLSGNASRQIRDFSIDTRTIKKGSAFIAIKGDNFNGHDFIAEALKKGAACIIVSEKPQQLKAKAAFIKVKNTKDALANIARALRVKYNPPVIAITGSAGKTTTKDMLAWILSGKFNVLRNEGTKNNHIGVPLTLCGLNKTHDIAVLELGTNHFGEIKALVDICRPNVGIITNIAAAHLEHFNDLDGVLKEKYTLIDNLTGVCVGVLNADDVKLRSKLSSYQGKRFILSFAANQPADFFISDIQRDNRGVSFLINGKHKICLNTLGRSNVYNAAAAVAVARVFGMDYKTIIRRLAKFSFPKGRLNLKLHNGVSLIDDTYNSNPLSLKQALEALENFETSGRRIFVMADMLELGAAKETLHAQAGFNAGRICDILITVGRLSLLAAKQALERGLSRKNIFTCPDTLTAAGVLNKISLRKGDVVLVKGSRGMKMEEVINAI